jgi:transposase
VLEESITLVLANAMHVKNVPGRKTDVNDATWLSELLAHGLVRGSFVPPQPTQELRDLMRTRKQLVRERAGHVQRIQKVLEDANIKLSSTISSVMGKSGRAMLEAIVRGETNPVELVKLANPRVVAARGELIESLRGRVTPHHRFMLQLHLGQIDALETSIATVDKEVGSSLQPFRWAVDLLKTIPGVSDISAQTIISEMGTDMSRFATSGHLISWAGLCPRNDESAGKKRTTRLRHGAPWLKTMLVQSAWCAMRMKDTYLRTQYHRIKSRRGAKKAVVAVAASILTAAYHMLRTGVEYKDLGPEHFTKRDRPRQASNLVKRLVALGYEVQLSEAA